MEDASPLGGSIIWERLHGFEDLHCTMQLQHQEDPEFYQHGSMVQQQTESVFPMNGQYMQEQPVSVLGFNDDERGKSLVTDDYLVNCALAGINEHNEVGKLGNPWQRIKWTDKMVKLLITAVSYIRQYDSSVIRSGRNESSHLLKIGKWKLVSNIMVERGCHVSPQQCEDKFNNLNKTYKRLNDVLGKGTSCRVVENPKLLDEMDISEKAKEDLRKMLSSKQLFYEEMCSFHHGNKLYLLRDPDLQRSLQLALRKKDKYVSQSRWSKADDFEKQVPDAVADGQTIETGDVGGMFGVSEVPVTRFNKVLRDSEAVKSSSFVGFDGTIKGYQDNGTEDIGGMLRTTEVSTKRLNKVNKDVEVVYPLKFAGFNKMLQRHPQQSHTDLNQICPEGSKNDELQKQWMTFRLCRLRVQRLQVKAQMLKLEKQQFKWQRIRLKQDRKLSKMRLENETLKIENERMAIEMKFKQMSADYNLIV